MNGSGKTFFSFEGVNTQEKKSLQSENFEEKHEEVPSPKQEKQEKNFDTEQLTIRKKEYAENDSRNEMIQYAYNLGGWDLVALMECENATWNPFRQSDVVKNGRREPSFGLCMIDKDFHPQIIDDPRFWEDWKFQVETCHRLYTGGTKFYGPGRIIKGVRCSDYVKDRFIIS